MAIKKIKNYRDEILKVADDICNKKNTRPRCVDYEKAIANLIINNPSAKRVEKAKVQKTIHSSVFRTLKNMVRDGELYCFSGIYYYPDRPKYRRKHYFFEIQKNVRFGRGDIHRISNNTCAITMEDIPDEKSINLIKEFIGPSCYSITPLNNLLIVMLIEDTTQKDLTTMEQLANMIKQAFDRQPQRRTKLKIAKRNEEQENTLQEDDQPEHILEEL